MFQIDYKKLVTWLIPDWLPGSTIMLLVAACLMPVSSLYNAFVRFKDDKLYRLNHNSQVCYLRAVLNDKFDLLQRRILITKFDGIERLYFWPDNALRDVNFEGSQFFWPDNAYTGSGITFTVKIPVGIAASPSEMARLVSTINEYKLPSKDYNIVTI